MNKPRTIQWLEQQTGQILTKPDGSPLDASDALQDDTRHLTVRLPIALHARLDELATERNLTVSQLVRQLLTEGVTRKEPDREAIETAIAALDEMRRRLPSSAA